MSREVTRRALIRLSVVALFAATAAVTLVGGDATSLVGFIAFPIVGAVILTSRPGNGVGRFLLTVSLVWTVTSPLLAADLLRVLPAGFDIAASAWAGRCGACSPSSVCPSPPDGSRRGLAAMLIGYVAVATAAAFLTPSAVGFSGQPNTIGVAAVAPVADVVIGPAAVTLFVALIVAIVTDLVVRWRRCAPARMLPAPRASSK